MHSTRGGPFEASVVFKQNAVLFHIVNNNWSMEVFIPNFSICPKRNTLFECVLLNFDFTVHSQFKHLCPKSHKIVYFMPARPWLSGDIERSGCPPSVDQVNIFVQGRISRPINGSKLIFHMRMYLYETSRNIQEPWPHDLFFPVYWLWSLSRSSRLRFLS